MVGRGDQSRGIACSRFDLVQRAVGEEGFELLGVLG